MTGLTVPAAFTAAPGGSGGHPTDGAPPGAPPGGPPFHGALEAEWARTAIAEGQRQTGGRRQTEGRQRSHDASATAPAGVADGGTGRGTDGAGNIGLPLDGAPAGGGPAAEPAPEPPAADEALPGAFAGPAPAGPGDLPKALSHAAGHGSMGSDPEPASTDPKPTGPNPEPASTNPKPTGPNPEPASTSSSREGSDSPGDTASPPRSSAPAAGAIAPNTAHPQGAGAGGGSWGSQADARGPAEQEGARASGSAGAHDKLWVPNPESTAGSSAGAAAGAGAAGGAGVGGLAEGGGPEQAPAAPDGDPQGPLLDYGVGLQQAIETLHGTIQLAARQGLSQARIALEPEGLGEIRIHLTQTAQGLLARVTAETPAAAQALAGAHAELRQSLSSLGLDLARLDIGRHGHSAAQGGGTAFGGGSRDGASSSGEASHRGERSDRAAATRVSTDSTTDPDTEEDAQPAPAPARGTLVDVLA